MSNTVLAGQRQLSSLVHTRSTLASHYSVTLRNDTVTSIDAAAKQVLLAGGGSLCYDRLVLAPGLEFDKMPGMSDVSPATTPTSPTPGRPARRHRCCATSS